MTNPSELLKMADRLEAYPNRPVFGNSTLSMHTFTQDDLDRAEAASLLRRLAGEMEWQTMDTAPRDGTWVQLTGGKIDYGWDDTPKPPIVVAQWVRVNATDETRWQFAWYDSGYYGEYENPTNWRPLPKGAS